MPAQAKSRKRPRLFRVPALRKGYIPKSAIGSLRGRPLACPIPLKLSCLTAGVIALLSARQIEIVKALAEQKSFALAAKALDVSQPSLTRSLKAIEKTLGVQLIERRGVTPTIFGEVVLRHGDRVLDGLSEIEREIDLAQGLGMGKLTIAAGPYAADISGMRAVGVLAARHPKLAVDLRFADWSRIATDTLESRLDLGLADITQAVREPDLLTEAVRTSQVNFFALRATLSPGESASRSTICSNFPGPAQAFPAGSAPSFRRSTKRSAISTTAPTDFTLASLSRPFPPPRTSFSEARRSGPRSRARSTRKFAPDGS